MKYSPTALRSARRRATAALIAAGAASLALAASAGAAVLTPLPDNGNGTDHLAAAITTANTNSDPSNTIVLSTGTYTPETAFSATAGLPPITKNLTITSDHADQGLNGTPASIVDGSHQSNPLTDTFTIGDATHPGVNVTLAGFDIPTASGPGFAVIRDNGNLTTWGLNWEGDGGTPLIVSSGASAVLNESTEDGAQSFGISNSGNLTVNNSDIVGNASGGINNTGGTVHLNNTLLANNAATGGLDCSTGSIIATQDHSMDDDGSCRTSSGPLSFSNVQYWNINGNFPFAFTNGGPTATLMMDPAAPTVGAGDPAVCPTVDGRFFVIPTGTPCDVGAEDLNATQQTTGPICNQTNIINGPPKQQQVFVTDSGSGMGPEAGAIATDVAPTLIIGAPPVATPVSPGDAISDVAITNGSVALSTPFSAPSRSQMTVTATKTNQAVSTRWSFTAWNWAGVPTHCS